MQMSRIAVVAFSGGLDTSCIVSWLKEDLYGYDNGPRCYPVVDDDRVYIFGAEGKLHCLNVVDGKVQWKVDTE